MIDASHLKLGHVWMGNHSASVDGIDEQARKESLRPLLDQVLRYFNQSLASSRMFERQIEKILSAIAFQSE